MRRRYGSNNQRNANQMYCNESDVTAYTTVQTIYTSLLLWATPPTRHRYIHSFLFSLSLSMLEFVDRVRLYGGRDRAIGSTGQSKTLCYVWGWLVGGLDWHVWYLILPSCSHIAVIFSSLYKRWVFRTWLCVELSPVPRCLNLSIKSINCLEIWFGFVLCGLGFLGAIERSLAGGWWQLCCRHCSVSNQKGMINIY